MELVTLNNKLHNLGALDKEAPDIEVAVQVVKGDIEDPLHLFSRHLSLQYLTSFQFLAHFLRHSNSRPQRRQVLGGNPFLTFTTRDIGQS